MEAIAQRQGLAGWQKLMFAGFGLWIVVTFGERLGFGENGIFLAVEGAVAFLQLITGIFILQGACEALVQSVERLGARLHFQRTLINWGGSTLFASRAHPRGEGLAVQCHCLGVGGLPQRGLGGAVSDLFLQPAHPGEECRIDHDNRRGPGRRRGLGSGWGPGDRRRRDGHRSDRGGDRWA